MLKTFLKNTALFLLLICSFSSLAEETLSPKQLLQEMKKASDQLNYEFSFIQTTPSNMDSFALSSTLKQMENLCSVGDA